MGILSTLLTGGVIVGKICQTIAGALSNAYVDDETGEIVAVSDISVSGVTFMQSNAGSSGMASYAVNSNSHDNVSVVFPNDRNNNGLAYEIPPIEKVRIDSDLQNSESPDKEILVGIINDDVTELGDSKKPLVKLSMNNMVIGGDPVTISDYEIRASSTGLQIKSGSRTLGAMTHLNLVSDSGISVNSQGCINANENANEDTYNYDVGLCDVGFKQGDMLSGQIHVEMTDAVSTVFSTSKAEPLHPVEIRCLRKLGIIKE